MSNLKQSSTHTDNSFNVMKEFNIRKKISSNLNRYKFLKECIAEKVLPKSAPAELQKSNKPFSEAARAYLEDACSELRDKLYELREDLVGASLPGHLKSKLAAMNEQQRSNLSRKLKRICDTSKWKDAGNAEIVTNVSMRTLSATEKEALSLGLKFDSGKDRFSYVEHVDRNYKWNDNEADKGFIQGLLAACKALADKEPNALPRRYLVALEALALDKNIVVTQADKGGGVIIMDSSQYLAKLNSLLADAETYLKRKAGSNKKQSLDFNKKARKILKKREEGKKFLHLIEESPKSPQLKGLPKLHKQGLPMRPIISGIGSAPHKLAKILAKPLTKALGTISGAHIRNTSDMMHQLENINMSGKKLASFDVKSLFTNVPVDGALDAIRRAVNLLDERTLPLPKNEYLELVSLCMHFNAFSFNDNEYAQISGLAMGSPLSPVAACLYLECLEEEHYSQIMGEECTWIRYVDDVLVAAPENVDLEEKLKALNLVNPKIQFTLETENEGKIPFLDTLIMRSGRHLKFTVYRKPTNKEDYVHFFSGHNERVKSGIVIGFFLRAFRVCSKEFLEEEIRHIFHTFERLKYPKGFIIRMKKKAEEIRERSADERRRKRQERSKRGNYISIPNSKHAETIANSLRASGSNIAIVTGRRVEHLTKKRNTKQLTDSVVYKIPCSGPCQKAYIGETGRGLATRLKEHKRDVKNFDTKNALVPHMEECENLPNWSEAVIIQQGMSKSVRKAMEAAHILLDDTINVKSGFFTWAKAGASIALGRG